jgi:SAM-dependent methyltransferase
MADTRIPAWKRTARSITPPLIWKVGSAAVRAFRSHNDSSQTARERDASYYDQMYAESDEYRKHYTESRYYFLWCVIVDRLKRANVQSVLDVGCGPGQFASLLRDSGIRKYCGIDLSENAVRTARAICGQYEFVATSVFDTNLFDEFDYDAVISLEFLEHVNEDIAILDGIRQGRRFYGSVPNFAYESHVRHFLDCGQVTDRYASLFTQFKVDEFPANRGETKYFLFEGVKSFARCRIMQPECECSVHNTPTGQNASARNVA